MPTSERRDEDTGRSAPNIMNDRDEHLIFQQPVKDARSGRAGTLVHGFPKTLGPIKSPSGPPPVKSKPPNGRCYITATYPQSISPIGRSWFQVSSSAPSR